MAIVYVPGSRGRKKRLGRGFSIGELQSAGISLSEAKKLGIYVDKRRRSVHQENVEYLKKLKESRQKPKE